MNWHHLIPSPVLAAAEGLEGATGHTSRKAMDALIERVPFPTLLAAIAVVFLATLVMSKVASKLNVPAVLGVLLLGAAINPDEKIFGPAAVENLHIVSLAMLLFYAGLKTNLKAIRKFLGYGLLLAVGGVALSSLIFGGIIYAVYAAFGSSGISDAGVLPLPMSICMLVAACLGSTDAGATLSVLSSVKRHVPLSVRHLLQFESSVNDPAAILFLTLVIGIIFNATGGREILGDGIVEGIPGQIQVFIKSVGSGIMIGLILTYIGQFIIKKFIVNSDQILIVGISIAMASYGLSASLQGSGFIAAYVTGLFLANNIFDNPLITEDLLENSLEPFNTLMEMLVFLLFGVIIDPGNVRHALTEGFLCAAGLMFVARPISVLLFSKFSPFNSRENVLISWCGLRGAVPLALAYNVIHTIQELPGLSHETIKAYSSEVEGLIFLVVLINLALQGFTLPLLSKRLGLQAESQEEQPA